jgi:hypothetical protein
MNSEPDVTGSEPGPLPKSQEQPLPEPKSLEQLTAEARKNWSLSHKLENWFLGLLLALAFDREAKWLLLVVILSLGGIAVLGAYSLNVPTAKPFQEQMQRLKDTEAALAELTTFVNDQRTKLQESQQVMESLKKEHDELKPVVDAKRELVDALFAVQAKRERNNMWINRGLGVLGTIVAAGIVRLIRIAYRGWKNRKRKLAVPANTAQA